MTTSFGRRIALAVAVGLCLAAAVAIFALLSGSFDDTDLRLMAASLGFAVFSATGGAGEGLRRRRDESPLGLATVIASGVAFVLLLAVLAIDDSLELVRAWGIAGLLALAGSHASLVLRAARPTDTPATRNLVTASVALGALDALLAILAIAGAIDVGDAGARAGAVVVVLLLLTTALPPLLRRTARSVPEPAAPALAASAEGRTARLAAEVLAAADRLEPHADTAQFRHEVGRLRQLARAALD